MVEKIRNYVHGCQKEGTKSFWLKVVLPAALAIIVLIILLSLVFVIATGEPFWIMFSIFAVFSLIMAAYFKWPLLPF